MIITNYEYEFVTILSEVMSGEEEVTENANFNAIKLMTDRNINEARMAAAGRLSFDLVALIEQEIQTNQFQVNEVQKDFKLKHRDNKQQAKKHIDPIAKRNQPQEECDKSREEDPHSVHTSYNERKYFKSEMTQEDIEKIKKIKLLQKKYDLELENKVKLYEQSLKKFHEEEKDLLQKQKKEKNEERLKEVAKNIEQIRNRQDERKKKMEEEKKRLTEIKNQKKLYQRLDEQYKSVEMQEERKKEEIKLALKVQKNIHFDDIKEHEKKYDEIMRAQREQREKKLGQLVRGTSKKYYQSRLLKDCIQQDEKAKIEHIQKKNQLKQYALKKEEYAEYVRNNYRPNFPQKEGEQQESNPHTQIQAQPPAVRSASVHELYKLGNEYMKQAHENVQNLKGSSVSKIQKIQQPFKYKNYLQEIKADRKPSSQKDNRYLEQIDSLLKKENMTQQQKFYKAKLIAQKIEEKKGRDSQKIIESINAKIHLLKHIDPL